MRVTNNSWHFKLANEYGGLNHQNGFKHPTLCGYLWSVLEGMIMFVLTEIIFSWVIPIGFDILFFGMAFTIIFGVFDLALTCIFSLAIAAYLVVVVAFYKDCDHYIGPLCILQHFMPFKFIKKIAEKLCQPVKIVYVKEED